MSLQSWKDEYYPIKARDCEKEDALAHSQQKWEGLKFANLTKHQVYFDFTSKVIRETLGSESLRVDDSTCALCFHFHSGDGYADDRCDECPLAKARDYVPCDAKYRGDIEGRGGPFVSFTKSGNPVSMIRFLKKAEAFK